MSEPEPAVQRSSGPDRVFSPFGVAAAVLAVLALAAAVLTGLLWSQHRAAESDRTHQARALKAAADWTSILINMNAENVETSLQRLRDGTVGELNTGFEASIAPYREIVKTLRSTTTGQVDSVAIEAVHRDPDTPPGEAPPTREALPTELATRTDPVLVIATSVSENPGGKPTTVRWNLRLGVSDVDGTPKVSRLESLR